LKTVDLDEGPWRTQNSWVSYFNFDTAVLSQIKLPSKVIIHDVTLRDGEQTPGVVFRKDEKVKIALKLDEVGIGRIEAGFPAVSEEDKQAVEEIAKLGLRAKIFTLSRLTRRDVDAALDCDVDGVVCEGSTSDIHLKYRLNLSREVIFDKAVDTIQYAKEHGLYASFMSVDSTRTELSFLIQFINRLASETKVDSITVTDSYCTQHPLAFMIFIKNIKENCQKPLEIHCHNELGLAVANTLMGVAQGAEVVHVSVNGLGEKTGNASLEETVMALKLLFGMDVGLKYEKLYELSRLVQELSGVNVHPYKPIVGENAFARESGLVVYGLLKFPLSVQSFNPEMVGNRSKILLGKKSGRESIRYKLKEMGIQVDDELLIDKIVDEVKRLSISKKGTVTDEEFLSIVRGLKG